MMGGAVVLKGYALTCQLAVDDERCRRPGSFHIAWAKSAGAGFSTVCDGHFGQVFRVREPVIAQWHLMQADCGMPGTGWHMGMNMCELWDGKGGKA